MNTTQTTDFEIAPGGTQEIVFKPLTDAARNWLSDNLGTAADVLQKEMDGFIYKIMVSGFTYKFNF